MPSPSPLPTPMEPPAPAGAGERTHPSLWRGLPRPVVTATVLWCALMAVWSLVLPGYRSADEVGHVSAGLHWEHHRSWPGFKELPADRGAHAALDRYGFLQPGRFPYPALPADGALPRDQRPSFDELGAGEQLDGVVTMGQHPPAYYVLLGTVGTLLPDDTPADREIWLLRLLSVALLAPLPAVVAAAVRRFGGSDRAVLTGALLPFAVPQLAVTAGAVNNDNLLTAACAWLALGVAVVATGDLRARTGALFGLAAAVALLAKAWALFIVPVVAVAYLVAAWRTRRWRRAATGLAAFGTTAMAGGWWWINNVIRYGQVQPSGHFPAREEGRLSLSEGLGTYVERFVEWVPGRFWALLSVKDGGDNVSGGGASAFPWLLTAVLSVALLGLMVVALLRRRTFDARRTDVALLLAPFGLTLVTLVVSTWNIYARTGLSSGLQGRYLFAALPGVLVVVALVLGRVPGGRRPGLLPLVTAGAALAFTGASLLRAVTFHWGSTDTSLTDAPRAMVAWAPVPWWFGGLLAALFVASLVVLSTQLVSGAGRAEDGGPGPDADRTRDGRPRSGRPTPVDQVAPR